MNELFKELNSIENPVLSEQISASSAGIKVGIENLVTTISTQILTDGKITINVGDYFNLATKPIDDLIDIFNTVITYASQQYTRKK